MQALLWGIPNTHVNALCLRTAFTTLQPDPARKRSQSWQLPRYRTCGTPANRRSVGKRSKRSDRQFSFPLIRKSATSTGPLGGFSDLRKTSGGLSEDPKKRHHESQNWRSFGFAVSQALLALALCSTRESRRQEVREVYRAYVHIRIRLEYARSSRHCVALDSLLDAASTSAHLAALVDAAVQHPSNVSRTTA